MNNLENALARSTPQKLQQLSEVLGLNNSDPEIFRLEFLTLLKNSKADICKIYAIDRSIGFAVFEELVTTGDDSYQLRISSFLSDLTSSELETAIELTARQKTFGVKVLSKLIYRSTDNAALIAGSALARHQFEESIHLPFASDKLDNPSVRKSFFRMLYYVGRHVTTLEPKDKEEKWNILSSILTPYLDRPDGEIRRMAFITAVYCESPQCRSIAETLINDRYWRVRKTALQWFGKYGEIQDLNAIVGKVAREHEEVKKAAREAIESLSVDKSTIIDALLPLMGSKDEDAIRYIIQYIGRHGNNSQVKYVTQYLQHESNLICVTALFTATKLDPANESEYAFQALLSRTDAPLEVFDILERAPAGENLLNRLFKAIREAEALDPIIVFRLIETRFPDRKAEAIELGLHSPCDEVKSAIIKEVAAEETEFGIQILKKLLRDPNPEIRRKAIAKLKWMRMYIGDDDEIYSAIIKMLDDPDDVVQFNALVILQTIQKKRVADPVILARILPLTRNVDSEVREVALELVSHFDDLRVLGELISSLNDVIDEVVEKAEEILNKNPPVPCVSRANDILGTDCVKIIRNTVKRVNGWASEMGTELLGRPVRVINYRQGLGRTSYSGKGKPVEIEISETPVTSCHPHGEEIMKGLALHEIGHHLFHLGIRGFLTMRGIARSEGILEIFNILADEQVERAIRSRRSEWGIYIDKLASYTFAQNTHIFSLDDYAKLIGKEVDYVKNAIESGVLPGKFIFDSLNDADSEILLSDADLLQVPGLIPVHMAFLMCLLCGHDPARYPDSRVAEAIASIPGNLKDLKPSELLTVSRKIGAILGKSEQFNRDWKELQERIKHFSNILHHLQETLNRLLETGRIPEKAPPGFEGIREMKADDQADQEQIRPSKKCGPSPTTPQKVQFRNLHESLDFPSLEHEEDLPVDPAKNTELIIPIRKHIRKMRAYFENLSIATEEELASRRGRRLDMARVAPSVLTGNPGILVFSHEKKIAFNAYIGLLIDRSFSMEGSKLELAKSFGLLLSESLKGLPGVNGHVNAFDDEILTRMGTFKKNAIGSLDAQGGNNDCGALVRAAELAVESGKRNRLIIVISDGSPTNCSINSLKNVVSMLMKHYRIVCAQIAVEELEHITFPHFLDLSRYSMNEAVARFGKLLRQLSAYWT